MRLLYALGLFLALLHLSNSLMLGAFNIKSFGDKKASNATLMNIISTVCIFLLILFALTYIPAQITMCKIYTEMNNKVHSF